MESVYTFTVRFIRNSELIGRHKLFCWECKLGAKFLLIAKKSFFQKQKYMEHLHNFMFMSMVLEGEYMWSLNELHSLARYDKFQPRYHLITEMCYVVF